MPLLGPQDIRYISANRRFLCYTNNHDIYNLQIYDFGVFP